MFAYGTLLLFVTSFKPTFLHSDFYKVFSTITINTLDTLDTLDIVHGIKVEKQ